ncbi:membrane protein [Streptomyces sp. WM6373]|nr:membrane protein [Streptomyces sp. WM6373]KOU65160.1 membrane protein [Streptomyces sp. IGB124]KOU85761.1 membrane protein [Streptomyces sp. XY58]KOU86132.1 membrane protein [Streptomyces sp. XY66]KOV05236.1 membrane protein [Streptomyces sp. XY37]KOV25908.1 membrane protein [Streptomyces sp. XY413]KOV30863.1 membrane protein [Streptomyces sp. H021]KOV47441.1 membrane protein [Streptomyces sp. MMG1064]
MPQWCTIRWHCPVVQRGGTYVAVQEMSRGTHTTACACEECAREGHRRAVAAFLEKRDEFAAGQGVPAAVAHSLGASRQWVSDELTLSARTVADRGREAGNSWLYVFSRRAVLAVWIAAGVLLLVQVAAALGTGWSTARTAGLLAALLLAGLLTVAARAQSVRGGLLAPLVGEDNRLSTSKAVPTAWVVLTSFATLLLALRLAASAPGPERRALYAGLALDRALPLLSVVVLTSAVAVLVRRVVSVRIMSQRLQKLPADRPRGADLLTDDAGRGSFPDAQYVLVSTVVLAYAAASLARFPGRLPQLPWALALLVALSAAVYLAAKYAEGSRPLVLSVVRRREPGDLDAAVRPGDDIEIRGVGFVPPGAQTPEMLARLVVRIGAVHVHVPLVPVPGGFTNPSDAVLTVPVPAEVEPGRTEIQVVTAAGVESNRCTIDVAE